MNNFQWVTYFLVRESVGRHLYISSPGTKWNGFGAIVIEEVRPQGREDIPDSCTEQATRCKKYTFNCKYWIDLANLVAILCLKLCWTRLVDSIKSTNVNCITQNRLSWRLFFSITFAFTKMILAIPAGGWMSNTLS